MGFFKFIKTKLNQNIVLLSILRHLLFFLVSPFLILIDLFRFRSRPRIEWLCYYLCFFLVFLSLTGVIIHISSQRIDHSMEIISNYHELKFETENLPFEDLINIYAVKNNIDPSLVAAVIKQESQFDPYAVSPRNAKGLMQIRASTWRELNPDSSCDGEHEPYIKSDDCIFHPETNIRYGTFYLKELIDFFDGDLILALSAYNAGYGNMVRYESQASMSGIPPFQETQHYVSSVIYYWNNIRTDGLLSILNPDNEIEFGYIMLMYRIKDYMQPAVIVFFLLLLVWSIRVMRFEKRTNL